MVAGNASNFTGGVLHDMALNFSALQMYPIFDVAHHLLSCISVRQDLSSLVFARKNPFALWISSMICCFAGGILSNLLLGLPVISPFESYISVLHSTICWYLIFYSPKDIIYKICCLRFFKVPMVALKEVQRARKVSAGIAQAASIYPSGYLIMVVLGTVKGAGSGVMRGLDRSVRGFISTTPSNELLKPSFVTKMTFAGASILTATKVYPHVVLPYPQVVLLVSLSFVYFRVAMILVHFEDPCRYLEWGLCSLLFGSVPKEDVSSEKQAGATTGEPHSHGDKLMAMGHKKTKGD